MASNNQKGNIEEIKEKETKKEKVSADTSEDTRIKALEDQIAKLTQMLTMQQSVMSQMSQPLQPVIHTSSGLDEEVAIIFNMVAGSVRAIFPSWKLSLNEFGEKTVITKAQLQELVNNHRSWFKKEYILLDGKHLDLAQSMRIPVYNPESKEYVKPEDLDRLSTMDAYDIESYYKNLSDNMQKSLTNYLFNKCCQKDRNFYDVNKMNIFNHMTKSRLFDNLIMTCSSEYGDGYDKE